MYETVTVRNVSVIPKEICAASPRKICFAPPIPIRSHGHMNTFTNICHINPKDNL